MRMSTDELEFLISQYLDGTLNPLEKAVLEERLASDVAARELLGQYWQLDALVKRGLPEPRIDHDALRATISSAVSRAELPIKHFKLTFARVGKIAAIAASIIVAIGVWWSIRDPGRDSIQSVGNQ